MELGPITKRDKRNTAMWKKLDDDIMSATYDVIVIFPIHGLIWEQSGSWIPNAWSVKLTFSLIVSFCLKKLETWVRSGDSGQWVVGIVLTPPKRKTITKKPTQIKVKRWYTIDFFLKIFFLRQLISGTCSRSNVVKSVYSRVSVCVM